MQKYGFVVLYQIFVLPRWVILEVKFLNYSILFSKWVIAARILFNFKQISIKCHQWKSSNWLYFATIAKFLFISRINIPLALNFIIRCLSNQDILLQRKWTRAVSRLHKFTLSYKAICFWGMIKDRFVTNNFFDQIAIQNERNWNKWNNVFRS